MSSIRSHRLKGNTLFESGQLREAADAFQLGVHAFLDARSTAPDDVEEFVKVAGNWLVCLHEQSEYSTCVATARQLLSTYPIIPKAYGAMGMCIVKAIQRRQEIEAALDREQEHQSSTDTSPTKKASVSTTPSRTTRRCVTGEAGAAIHLTHCDGSSQSVDEPSTSDTAVAAAGGTPSSSAALCAPYSASLSTTGTRGPAVESSAGAGTAETPLPASRARTAEERRQDPRRYWVKLDDLVCTIDDAHTYLCRALSLAPSLQRSLQPYLDTAVRLISEQLLSTGPALERELGAQRRRAHAGEEEGRVDVQAEEGEGTFVLEATCPAEDGLYNVPVTPSTAPKVAMTRVQMLNVEEPNSNPVSLPDSTPEAQAARAQYAAEQQQEQAQAVASPVGGQGQEGRLLPEQLRPSDFVLSGVAVPVRVCHSERGGLPRSLTLVRAASTPFAVARWVQAVATTIGPDGRTPCLLPGHAHASTHHVDPTALTGPAAASSALSLTEVSGTPGLSMGMLPAGLAALAGSAGGVGGGLGGLGGGGGASWCVACAKEMSSIASGCACAACGLATYCSAACEAAYKSRHDAYECAGFVCLQSEISLAAEASLHCPSKGPATSEPATTSPSTSASLMTGVLDLAGEAWSEPDLLHRVLPLTLVVYSGLCERAAGWERVSQVLARGVHRNLRALMPPTVARILERLQAQLPPPPAPLDGADGGHHPDLTTWSLLSLFFLCRLYHSRHMEHEVSSFYVEKLLLRHSCEPNCVWSDVTRSITTGRFIAKGEELTLAVDPNFPQHWPHQVRTKWWLRYHGFICQCSRCARESRLLNGGRGDLSDDLVEQLLTADVLRRPTSVSATLAAQSSTTAHLLPHHPTHYFHPLVQTAILTSRNGRQTPEQAVAVFHALRTQCAKYLLPTHYLFEDLRAAECTLAELTGQADLVNVLGRESMLFLESLWAGAIPSKTRVMEAIPQTFDCRRRNVHNRRMRRQNKSKPLVASTPAEAPSAPASSAPLTTVTTTRTTATVRSDSAEEVEEQSIVEKFMGSYRAWYL